jgi:osmotically-inducible protein OsmY
MLRYLSLALIFCFTLHLQGCSKIISITTDGPIDEDRGERTAGSVIDDEIIETKLLVNLDNKDPQFTQAHISVTSYNGVVLLTGQVPTESLRQIAAEVASNVNKVRRVHNELAVSGTASMVARSNDTWITTKLKSKMFIRPKIQGGRIKVVTENGTVYLMGLLSRDEGQRAANLVRQTAGVQKVVILFEYIN